MGKENHVFAPAYKDADIKELGEICDHIIFNSFAQLRRHTRRSLQGNQPGTAY